MEYDVFVCHASEDKLEVALPLAEALKCRGLRVWIDTYELRIGDSLREKIDAGLATSRFGIVILSPSFFGKLWTRNELGGLFALEKPGRPRILPVWHKVDAEDVAKSSPLLADRLALKSIDGSETMADQIATVVLNPASESPSTRGPTLRTRLLQAIEATTDAPDRIRSLLKGAPTILENAFGYHNTPQITLQPQLGTVVPDLCIGNREKSIQRMTWSVMFLESPSLDLVHPQELTLAHHISSRLEQVEMLRGWIDQNMQLAREQIPGLRSNFIAVFIGGRRARLSTEQSTTLGDLNDTLFSAHLHTYDWLIDAAPGGKAQP